ncbi:heat shock factor protein [Erpetoichthys calabaricus]|uniref:Heat shock factor protein-like n=2 Tax=Erpetoichthys calabaricus TaxID=27687 RepID=A0A8C4SQG9_ERPCA|nr:heat shock factor protein [Erpetoichthys calabaricus]
MKQNCTVPAFLSKLWTLVEDHSTNDLICWSRGGSCLQVSNERQFSKEILPLYFKHNNMASFVRQLNMYGFHKVVHVDVGLPRDKEEIIEFQHPYFQCGTPHLLQKIKRKVSLSRGEEVKLKKQDVSKILMDILRVKSRQAVADAKFMAIKRENETLWNEVASLRQKHLQQHKVIRKVVHFIASMAQSNSMAGIKRKLPLMIDNSGLSHSTSKYSRPITMEPSMESSAVHGIPRGAKNTESLQHSSIYPGGKIISDITHLLEQGDAGHVGHGMEGAGSWGGKIGGDKQTDLMECPQEVGQRAAWKELKPQRTRGVQYLDVSWKSSLVETLLEEEIENLVPNTIPTPFTPVDLFDYLLEDCGGMGTEEGPNERCEIADNLAQIDANLAQINSSLSGSNDPSDDLLKDLFDPTPGVASCCLETMKDHTVELKKEHGYSMKQTSHESHTDVAQYADLSMQAEVEDEDEDASDILPTLLELAQEASSIDVYTAQMPLDSLGTKNGLSSS